ncbi:MAG: dihydrolipoyl dehydrogenase [Nitrospirales bacterium]|nr:dihydrolipoyl dehydrogenase [Nitrospirales bacterium]
MSSQTRLVILGAGPGGYVAAIRAAQLGAQVTLIENQALGGVCLNWGCIPSKALLAVVDLGEKLHQAKEWGIHLDGAFRYDLAQMVARKNGIVNRLVNGIATLLKAWQVTHIQGTGELLHERAVRVIKPDGTETQVPADAIIVATGSSWPDLPLFPVDGHAILTSKELLDLKGVPARLLIVGGGVEGCEFASLMSALGAHVMLVEMMDSVLPLEDEEISKAMERTLKKQKVRVHTGVTVERLDRSPESITAVLSNGGTLETDQILVSIGRRFRTQGIGLEKVGVELGTRGHIEVNERLETNIPGIYAIGDVVGKAMLAHVASAQGKVAVENILEAPQSINYDVIPAGIFTLPEIGRVGITEQQAQARGAAYSVGRFRYAGLGKAQGTSETAGFFKIITDSQTDAILGAHIMGAHAADLIHEAALAMQVNAPAKALAQMIHAHPTLSEGMMEAAEDIEHLAIHQASTRK